MSLDVVDLRNFYAQPLGTVARRFVSRGIRLRWGDTRAQRIAGVGYATPYLGLFREEAERCLAFMPAAQGVVKWPSARPTLTALVEELDLPLPDAAVDRLLLVHALECRAMPKRCCGKRGGCSLPADGCSRSSRTVEAYGRGPTRPRLDTAGRTHARRSRHC